MDILKIPHKTYDYLCPINGVSDIYEWKSGTRIPDPLLFFISSIGFSYIRQKKARVRRMVFWGNGIGKGQYEFLKPVMRYRLHVSQGTAFPSALKKARKLLEAGIPVLLYGLDMYHLPYFEKFYRTIHIPGHIILMVGYSEDEQVIYAHDNSKSEVQAIPCRDLMSAWGEDYPEGQAKKNTLFGVQFHGRPPSATEIVRKALKKRAEWVLHPPVKFLGIPGMRMLSADFPNWEKELTASAYAEALTHMVMFTGSVLPALPPRLAKFDNGIPDGHQGAREKFADILMQSKSEYGTQSWEKAADLFRKSGNLIGRLTEIITEHIVDDRRGMKDVPGMLIQIAGCEEEAFLSILS